MNYSLQVLCLLFSIFIFGQTKPTTIQDEYLYLENQKLDKTKEWITSENEISKNHLEEISKKYNFKNKIIEYGNLSNNPLPNKKGKYFYSKYIKDKNTPASLFYRKKINDLPVELFNTYDIYNDKNISISNYFPSENSMKIGIMIDKNGGDKKFAKFVDFSSKKVYEEELSDIKFSNLAWNNDKGVFYKKNSNTITIEKDSTFTVYYHQLGSKQEEDVLVYDTSDTKNEYYFFTTKSNLYLVETDSNGTQIIYYSDLNDSRFEIKKLKEFKNISSILKIIGTKIYFTSKLSDWGEVKTIDILTDKEETLIPQVYSNLLVDTYFLGEYTICKYKTLDKNYLSVYTNEGAFVKKFEAPNGMDFSVKFYDSEEKNIYASFYSSTISFYNLILNIEKGTVDNFYNDYIIQKPTLFPFDYFTTKKITYKSRDNKDIPITIIHKKNTLLNGENPTILKAYGGFGSVNEINFDTGLLHFLEKGGVYAFAEIRGGGEKGKKWHLNGKGLNKMNCFNDFIDAAEFLIREKYTNPNKLAITGASHGGLVVGVALTQRPDLFKVAVPRVGVFDMLRFDKFSVGKYHLDEFGDPNNKEDFDYLSKYSPLHNIKNDVNYPTTLIMTSENDDRVPPLHSYKFAAKLKNRTAQKNNIYLNVLDNSGHYGKISIKKDAVLEATEFYSFIYHELTKDDKK
jgi:prolyl oligopeptidase